MNSLPRLLAILTFLAAAAPAASAGEEKPVLIVYPVISTFDDGELGSKVRQALRGHADDGGRVTGFDHLSEGELLAADPFKPEPEAELGKVADHARKVFGATYAAWGQIEKKKKGEGYTLRLLGARLGEAEAELAADETYDCPNVHHIPQHVETFLAKLLGGPRRDLERKWPEIVKELEEVCANGDFSEAGEPGGLPAGWSLVRLDLAPQTSWIDRPGGPGGPVGDKCLAYNMNAKTAASEGIAVMSDYIEVVEDAHYRAAVDILSKKPKVIIWIKGYAEVGEERREIFRHQLRYYPEEAGQWERLTTQAFRPRHPWQKVEWMRFMLYAYHPPGEVRFDNASVRRVEVKDLEEPDPAFVKEGGGEKLK